MAIAFSKYVKITSGVGGGAGVRQRELIGRIFTLNPLVPTKTIVEFDNPDDVAAYFGSASEEYARAKFYFGWVSKSITSARKLAFARWADQNAAPRIYGNKGQQAVGSWTSITDGEFTLTIGGEVAVIDNLDFSAALSLSDVATVIQTAIRTNAEPQFANATVTWDATRQSFNFLGTFNGNETIEVTAGADGLDVADQLGWLSGAILSDGANAETLTDCLAQSIDISNNFGTFLFMPALTLPQHVEIAEWNATQNVAFMYMVRVLPANRNTWMAELLPIAGTSPTVAPLAGEFPEMCPMIILAATRYENQNATQNYMFQTFPGLTPSVISTPVSNEYDGLRLNYYGRTQTAGQVIDFYQRGILTGQGTAPTDQNIYANEMWLKDAAAADIMELFMNLNKISANARGQAQLNTALQNVVDQALFNGVISVGKPLNNTQKLYIANITGDDKAWHQIQNIGYWYNVRMESYVTQDSRTEWKAVYTLIYAKDDVIRMVEGTHILI